MDYFLMGFKFALGMVAAMIVLSLTFKLLAAVCRAIYRRTNLIWAITQYLTGHRP